MSVVAVSLQVRDGTKCLAGESAGERIFQEQISSEISDEHECVVVLPDSIEDVSALFILGLYSKLILTYGKWSALGLMKLVSSNQEVQEKIDMSIALI